MPGDLKDGAGTDEGRGLERAGRFDRTPEGESEAQRFLTPTRIEDIAERIEPLICDNLSWLDRRTERVEILDETALRRQISVDFSLRSSTARPLLEAREEDQGQQLWCAPVFVLPKAPANLMGFDLEDEDGHALSLIGRLDNARISAAVLVRMARRVLGEQGLSLPKGLEIELRRVAEADDAAAGVQLARRLERASSWEPELGLLKADTRFAWWLSTLAHSSILAALFRSAGTRRKLVKLRFEQPLATERRWLTSLGWEPFRVGIDSPLIEARRYHLEAEAPPGLRITEASLSDDEATEPVSDSGFLRRVHLYRDRAQMAGAGTAVLWLRVSGLGFVGGAPLAAGLASGALIACFLNAREIAANPTSAPALLLVLPGLIATYIGRPDQHALTTRLLAVARRLLLLSALLAYIAAAKVALAGGAERDPEKLDARTENLEVWLGVLSLGSLFLLAALSVGWLRARVKLRSPWRTPEFRYSRFVAAPPPRLFAVLRDAAVDQPFRSDYELIEHDGASELYFVRQRWHGLWLVAMRVEPAEGGSVLTCDARHESWLKGAPLAPLVSRREQASVADAVASIQDWAVEEIEP
jgi:hypothetical protein